MAEHDGRIYHYGDGRVYDPTGLTFAGFVAYDLFLTDNERYVMVYLAQELNAFMKDNLRVPIPEEEQETREKVGKLYPNIDRVYGKFMTQRDRLLDGS